jgi:transketolase
MTKRKNINDYGKIATGVRVNVLRMAHRAQTSHVGGSLSISDLLAVLYSGILHIDPKYPDWPDRDRFILSKGHSCAALYAVLAQKGYFPEKWLEDYCQDGAHLAGHVTQRGVPGIEVSTGSLGHGLSIGCGMALAAKLCSRSYRIFVLLSDGECDEGSIWEAALFAPHHRLDNLVAIIDYNKIQSLGTVKDVLDLEPLGAKWRAFGWTVREIDGHNHREIEDTLQQVPFQSDRPSCIIAHTIKGKGISFMENQVAWHYRAPNVEQLRQALGELGVTE